MPSIVHIIGLVFFSLLLIKATDILIVHLKLLARKTKLGGLFLTSLIIGLATSLPELSVGIASALEGFPNLSLGNIIGSNIADLSLIIGMAALIGGTLEIRDGSNASDLFHAFLAGAAPLLLLWDKSLSRIDGLVLISLYGFYNYLILNKRRKVLNDEEGFTAGLIRRLHKNHAGQDVMYVFLGLALLLFSSDMIVKLGISITQSLNVPILLVGLFLVAVGTSLPELAFELKTITRKESDMAMGNLMGSIVANGTLIIGVTALLHPIDIIAFSEYLIATIFFIITFFLFFIFVTTKHKLERWEGAVLIFVYIIFFILEII